MDKFKNTNISDKKQILFLSLIFILLNYFLKNSAKASCHVGILNPNSFVF